MLIGDLRAILELYINDISIGINLSCFHLKARNIKLYEQIIHIYTRLIMDVDLIYFGTFRPKGVNSVYSFILLQKRKSHFNGGKSHQKLFPVTVEMWWYFLLLEYNFMSFLFR